MSVRILLGDCIEVMAGLPECSVDAIVTDPPYHLTTGKKGGSGPASVNLDSPYGRARIGTGFMGMKWDGGDVAFRPETWAAVLRVLKPGGHLLAFSGTRTYHRMVCAVEDAGFEIRDQLAWMFGTGFPKSHNGPWGGTALKPAWEPIVLARKPLVGTVAENVQQHGTGGLNIDGCRVECDPRPGRTNAESRSGLTGTGGANTYGSYAVRGSVATDDTTQGRWPANILHDGSDEVLAAFPRSDSSASKPGAERGRRPGGFGNVGASKGEGVPNGPQYGDTGSAARFFWSPKTSSAERHEGLEHPGHQFAMGRMPHDAERVNAGKRGNHHPTVKPVDLMRYLCRLITPPGGTVLDPFMGSGSTLKAAELEGFGAIGIELDPEYVEIARRRIAADAPLFADVEVSSPASQTP